MGKEEGEGSSRPPLHFFKIILSHTLPNGTLEIPPSFVKKRGRFLSKNACLEVSSGAMWQVRLKRREGRVWLHKGWREFAEYYSIKNGYFLVFRFKGRCHLHVFIFNTTGLEIEYPVSSVSRTRKVGSVQSIDGEDEGEVSVEILDECWQKPIKRRKIKGQEENSDNKNNVSVRAPDGKLKIRRSSHSIRKNSQGNALGARARVLGRAKAFKSRNPYFTVTMKPSYVSHKGYLYIPESHARSYFLNMGNSHICLKGPDGRTWSVDVNRYRQLRFCLGWGKFAQENHLQEGDVCVFELINSTAMVYRVTILHIADEEGTEKEFLPDTADEFDIAIKQEAHHDAPAAKDKVLQKAMNFNSMNPHFIIQMCPTYISSKGLLLPRSHTRRHLEGKTVIILHGSNGRTWAVLYHVAKSCDRGRFGRGWRDFVSDNQLQAGDTCIFEMISGKAKAYNVTILRVADPL